MGGVRNGKSAAEPGDSGSRQEALAVEALSPGSAGDVHGMVERHLQVAARLLRERHAPKAFGELVRASRTLPMTRRLAAALVTVSLKAGTEAAAITLLTAALDKAEGTTRRDVHRQLARVLRRVEQLPRALEALEALLAAFPEDHRSRRIHLALLERTGKWEVLVAALEREAQEAFVRGQFARAARATRWRARVQAEQMRNLARAAESYGKAANYLEQMEDADGALAMRLEGLRVLHSAGASETVLTGAASVCLSAGARLGRDAEVRQVLEELGLIPARSEPSPVDAPPAEPPRARWFAPPVTQELPAAPPPEAPSAPPSAPEAQAAPPGVPAAPVAQAEAASAVAAEAPAVPEAAPPQAEQAAPAPSEDLEDAALEASDGPPLTELLAIPDEEVERPAPPVAAAATLIEMPAVVAEPAPPPRPAAENREDPAAQQRLEAQLIAHKAWPELAQFYLARAERAKDPTVRAEALTRLAEVMEDELNDPAGAARMYREIVTLTGDRAALKEQVRLLAMRGDPALVQRALNEAVLNARTSKARADAHLTRAERALEIGDSAQAKADFETAEALTPGLLLVLAGLVRCVSDQERPAIAQRLRTVLNAIPRRSTDRLEALRVLAAVAEGPLKDARLAQWAWTEVLAEEPGETHAREQLTALARELGDKAALSQLLREQLARDPRGAAARQARLELVSTLEGRGDTEGALTELRQAVRFEPGHKEAWLLLAERLTERGQIGEAAWALEHAATATEDEAERQRTWARLARFCWDILKDPARAEVYARRAENLRRSMEEPSAPPVPEPPRSALPKREPSLSRTVVLIPPPGTVELTPSGQGFPPQDEPVTENHPPAPVPPDISGSPTIEFAAIQPLPPDARMPFSDEEPTATEVPEGFVPPGEPAAPVAPPRPAPAPARTSSKAPSSSVVDTSAELDALLGEDPSDSTSTSLSVWSQRDTGKKPAASRAGKGSAKSKKARTDTRKAAPAPEKPVPPTSPMDSAALADTWVGKRAAVNPPPPPREAPAARAAATGSRSSPPVTTVGGNSRRAAQGEMPAVKAAPAAREAPAAKASPPARRPVKDDSAFAQVSPAEPASPPAAYGNTPVQNTAFISWEAPPGKMEPVRRLARARAGTSPVKGLSATPPGAEPTVFQKVRERPLDQALYLQIADYFEEREDLGRAALMREIADAIEGREGPPPRPPRQPLSADDRSGLRHPLLRTPPGELLACVGQALCRLFPAYGRAAGTNQPLRPDSGPGAVAAREALEATERLLGIQAPEVVLSEDSGPPFSLVYASSPRLLVGKQAIRQVLPAAELRFYAGRALMCLAPDLLALRSLKKDQVLRGLALLSSVLKDSRAAGPEARVVRESLPPQQLERAAELFDSATRQFDMSALADAARDSANRAGLVACGGVGPAIESLRLKRALERELVELVRFAASERYFQLRGSR